MILLGIDFGDTRTGLAKLDTRYPIATPLETVRKNNQMCIRDRFETVFPACGSSNSAIELTIEELERYANASAWVDVCKGCLLYTSWRK